MTRRMQLLPPEGRAPSRRVATAVGRVRESLLRDNKVLPPVLAVLALLIFAWLVAGALLGAPGQQGQEEQTSSQTSLAQRPEDTSTGGGRQPSGTTPAPKVENRDADSYAGYDKPKDPFRDIFGKAGEKGKTDNGKAGDSKTGDNKSGDASAKTGDSKASDTKAKAGNDKATAGDSKTKAGDSKASDSKTGTGEAGDGKAKAGGEGPVDRSVPAGPGSPDGGGQGGGDQGGGGGLFNSGGDLPPP